MRRRAPVLLLAAAATIAAAPAEREVRPAPQAVARSPGFAAALADMPMITGVDGWRALPHDDAWAALARAHPAQRQAARWAYASSLVANGRGDEASGVLEVMSRDDPDLDLVPAWRLARGAAWAQSRRARQALAALAMPALAANPEACLWRMTALADAGQAAAAVAQTTCAFPALNARKPAARIPLILAASRAAIDADRPEVGLKWLGVLPDRDPAANLLRGKALLAMGQAQAGRLRLKRVAARGTPEQRADAEVTALEAGTLRPDAALKRLDRLRFAWRGDGIEERALRLGWRLGGEAHDARRSMAAGATLFRHFDLGPDTAPVLADIHARLDAALDPASKTPLTDAAGLYWDHRDLAPAGVAGDALANRLADRLQAAGLYARAAELLQYQLFERAQDIAKGPLSVKVATLHILSGHPDRALRALRGSDGVAYPDAMLHDRRRVEAAALHLSGRTAEALAVLADVPDGGAIRAEILWRAQDWAGLVATGEPAARGTLNEVGQAGVLRRAIAYAMLGREDGLSRLRARYGSAFAGSPSSGAFDLLTRPAGTIDPAAIAGAMAALPGASPAGAIGDLLDAEVAKPSGGS